MTTLKVVLLFLSFFFFKQKTAYEMLRSLVGSEMCIRDSFLGRGEIVDAGPHGPVGAAVDQQCDDIERRRPLAGRAVKGLSLIHI